MGAEFINVHCIYILLQEYLFIVQVDIQNIMLARDVYDRI